MVILPPIVSELLYSQTSSPTAGRSEEDTQKYSKEVIIDQKRAEHFKQQTPRNTKICLVMKWRIMFIAHCFVFSFTAGRFVCKHSKNMTNLYLPASLQNALLSTYRRTYKSENFFSKSSAVWTATFQAGFNTEMLWYYVLSLLCKSKRPSSHEFRNSSGFKRQLGLKTYAWVYAN